MWSRFVYPAMAVGASLAVFAPVSKNFFHVDDFCHLFNVSNLGPLQFFIQPWGGHVQLARNAVLWMMFQAFGMDVWLYFTVILLLHGLNVFLLYRVLHRYTGSCVVACIGAATWGVCPLHVEAIGWLSVVGQVVLSTIYLTILLSLEETRDQKAASLSRSISWALLALVASFCFGMGLSVALLLPFIVSVLGPPARLRRASLVIWLTPLVALSAYFFVRAFVPSPVGAFVDSTVSLPAALGAWRFVLHMTVNLLTYGVTALCLGVFGSAFGFPTSERYVIASACAAALAFGFARMPPLWRRRTLIVTAVSILTYVLVAAGRGPFLEGARFTAVKAAKVGRYHYFPLLGVVLALGMAGRALVPSTFASRRWLGAPALGLWFVSSGIWVWIHPPLFNHYEWERRETKAALQRIQAAIEEQPRGASVVIPNRPFVPADRVPCEVFGTAGLYLMAFGGSKTRDGGAVQFTVPKAKWEAAQANRGRVLPLLIPEGK